MPSNAAYRAIINRYGFNSLGADAVADNLLHFHAKAREDPRAKPGLAQA
jgi:dihydroorotate dehydrogenase